MKKSLLIKGDNIIALKKLTKKYKNKIDLVYIDPPYNTNQAFYIAEDRATTISRKNESKIAYNDKMPLDEYLNYIEEVLKLIKELLSDEGSIYLHIDCKVGHYIKIIMDRVFGIKNFRNDITRIKSNPKNFHRKAWGNQKDMILFYTKSDNNIWNNVVKPLTEEDKKRFNKQDEKGRYNTVPCHAPGETKDGVTGLMWRGIKAPEGRHWRVSPEELEELDKNGLIEWSKNGVPRIKKYLNEKTGTKYQDVWTFKDPQKPSYPTEKNLEMLELIVQQSSNEDSIVMDCFCGSGTTLVASALNGRKFIGIDLSDEAIRVCKEKLEKINCKFEEITLE